MRIDAHQHFWNFDAARDTWITDDMSVLRRDFLPEHLLPELKHNGFQGSIAVQANQSENETRFLLELASHYPEILGVVGWVDLCSPTVSDSLRAFAANKKLRGVRHIAQAEPDDRFLCRKAFRDGIACLKEFGLAYDILVYPRQLPATIELVSRFPGQPFVIDHIAKPPMRSGEQMPWVRHIREIATAENVYCKVSGLITEADWHHWSSSDIYPYLDVVFKAFGPSRLMFGSDWPVCLLAGTYDRVLELVCEYTSFLSENERVGFFGLNAAKFYGLRDHSWTWD